MKYPEIPQSPASPPNVAAGVATDTRKDFEICATRPAHTPQKVTSQMQERDGLPASLISDRKTLTPSRKRLVNEGQTMKSLFNHDMKPNPSTFTSE